MPEAQYAEGQRRLAELSRLASQILPDDDLRNAAFDLLKRHRLRASDALQLAAALAIPDRDALPVQFVCLDELLRSAAKQEGFVCVP